VRTAAEAVAAVAAQLAEDFRTQNTVVGYSPEKHTVRGLVVELTRAEGEPIRIEVPPSAFGDLLELLQTWAFIQDPE